MENFEAYPDCSVYVPHAWGSGLDVGDSELDLDRNAEWAGRVLRQNLNTEGLQPLLKSTTGSAFPADPFDS